MQVASNGKITGGVTGKGFLPGRSGNPSGRGRDPLTTALKARLTPEVADKLADSLLLMATTPNRRQLEAIAEVFNRVEGRAIARQELGTAGTFDPVGAAFEGYSVPELKAMLAVLRDQGIGEERTTAPSGQPVLRTPYARPPPE
jgi:hypothetical protein